MSEASKTPARTPGPWDINPLRTVDGECMVCGGGTGHEYGLIATVLTEVDAAFIVEACNQHDELKRRADIAEQIAEALRTIEYASRKDSLSDRERLQSVRTTVCAALSAWEASTGNRRPATDDEIVEMTSREAALGPGETGND